MGGSLALWTRFAEAIYRGDEDVFLDLCRQHQDDIADDLDTWTTIPEEIRGHPEAIQQYVDVVTAVAQSLAGRFGRTELLQRLTRDEPAELRQWESALEQADGLMDTDAEQASKVLEDAMELGDHMSGSRVDLLNALTRGRLGTLAYRRKDFDAARSHTEIALGASLSADDVDGVLTYVRNLYDLEREQGNAEAAMEWAQRGARAAETGGRTDEEPAWLARCAEAALDAGAREDAAGHARSAASLARERLSADPAALSVVLNNAGGVFRRLGQHDAAAQLFEDAIEHRRTVGIADVTLAKLLENLAAVRIDGPFPAQAQPLLEEALALARALLPPDDLFIAELLNNLAVAHHKAADGESARRLYAEALAVREAAEKRDDTGGATLANLATLELEAGRDAHAKAALDRLDEAAARAGTRRDDEIWRISRMVRLQIELGNFALAGQLLQRLRAKLDTGQDSPDYVRTLFLEADVEQGLGDLDAATALLARGIEKIRAGTGFGEDELATSLNNFGLLSFDAGRLAPAEAALEESLALRSRYMADDAPEVLVTLNNLALVRHHQKRFDEAERLYRRVLEGRRRRLVPGHPNIAQSLFNLGMLLLQTGQIHEALGLLREQFEAENVLIGDMFAVSSEDERLAYVAKLRRNLNVLLMQIMMYANNNPEGLRLAFDVLLQRKGIVADAMAAERRALALADDTRDADPMRAVTQLRRRISRLVLDGPGAEGADAHTAELNRLVDERRRLEAGVARAVAALDPASRLRAANRRAVAAALPPDSALVEYLHATMTATGGFGTNAYFAFVLKAGHPDDVSMFPMGLADEMDVAVDLFRRAIVSGFIDDDLEDPDMVERDIGRQLRRVLIDRVREATGDRTHFVLSPDGELGQIPFECLPLDETGVVGDALRIDYVSSGRDLVQPAAAGGAAATAPLVVADPDFDLQDNAASSTAKPTTSGVILRGSGIRFNRLEDTLAEAELVSRQVNARALTGADALESRITACRSPRILHIATHGFFLPDRLPSRGGETLATNPLETNPLLRSGLALAGANAWLDGAALPEEADDGLLTAEDVTGMNLAGTELVVLSACDTGLGEYRSGEGVFGLRRAFALAGAHMLVMSLWQVPSEQTTVLMEVFYDRLANGRPAADALREAKAAVRSRWSETFFWGAFVAFGATAS